ncbi:fumarylacetoacetate hydrolase family protein [Paraphoma chrysanthemicola]|uniref:Fumarylacetoacetate hydrolase family protein n=1 Tax=Paraphoma chrysanthemicola TaxID=798071 RepID=A0A8K0R616_9PLEO|nr:fumarylacetoacetate hydrolase family protein [Paraphoma chrysanthemicola]
MSAVFSRLVRFQNPAGIIFYGEAGDTTISAESLYGKRVPTYQGQWPWQDDFALSGNEETVAKILSPLSSVPIFYGIGLNYRSHTKEATVKAGSDKHPLAFTKPPDALAGPLDDIPFSEALLNMDYEGELCVVIGKDLKNFAQDDDPTPYILGYTVGNDVSSRFWQKPEQSGGQHAIAKSFDKFAPIGPVIASTTAISDPANLTLETFVNGERRQKANTGELIFNLSAILEFVSRGVTLRPGTVIMTGTPAGVAASFRPQDKWLKDGDVVEVSISGIGSIKNKYVLE